VHGVQVDQYCPGIQPRSVVHFSVFRPKIQPTK
jgi:hypothetical protein